MNRNGENITAEEPENKPKTRSRAQSKAGGGLNLPGILITALFVLVEGWFFFRLLRTKLLPAGWMWLIGAGLLLLAVLVGFLCWNMRKRIRFLIGAVLALLGSVGLVIGSTYVDKAYNAIRQWEAPTDAQTVQMGVYVLAESDIYYVSDLNGQIVGIMEHADRDESEQVLDEISRGMSEPLQVQASYQGFGELVQALLDQKVQGIVLNQNYIIQLEGIEGFENLSQKLRLLTDYQAERPSTAPVETTEDPAASTQAASTEAPHHGTRSWRIIKYVPRETEETEATVPPETPGWLPEGPIETAPPPTQPPTAAPIDVPAGQEGRIFTVFVSGIDARGGGLSSAGNCDVNILAVVNMNTRQVLLISTPRDYYVSMSHGGGGRDKLTHAGYYGISESIGALRTLYGVNSQYYFRVGFEGFKKLINAMGGIDVYSEYDFMVNDVHFSRGINHLNGGRALLFVRHRKNMPGGDRARGTNQMAVIKAVYQKLASSSTISNLDNILAAVGGLAQSTVPYDTLAAFSRSVLNGESWNVVSYSVNGSNGWEYCSSIGRYNYVMYPDYGTVSRAQSLIRQVYNGEWVSP